MPSGFTNRWLGKVLGKLIGVGSGGLTAFTATAGAVNSSPNDIATLFGKGTLNGTASTVTLAVLGSGITKLSSVGGSTYNLGAPVARRTALLYTDTIGDGTRKVFAGAGVTFVSTLAGSAYLNLSTIAVNEVELVGLSSALWLLKSNLGAVTVTTI